MILSSAYIDSFRPPYSGGLTMLLCSYLTDTYNKNFGTNYGTSWPYIDSLIQSLDIGYWKPEDVVESSYKELF